MTEPQVQYVKTSDGVNIAFHTIGEGLPLVAMADTMWSHIQMEWHLSAQRSWYERLAEKRKLVRFDHRGSGLSERKVTDFSLEAQVRDLEAVTDRLGLGTFSLMAALHCGPVAISYVSSHPGRVSRLILWGSWARHADLYGSPGLEAVRALREALLEEHWEEFTETFAHWMTGWSSGESSREMAAFLRECTTPANAKAALTAARDVDVRPLLASVGAPTLVVHRAQSRIPVDIARDLTARIPGARLVVLEGRMAPSSGDVESAASVIDDFLDEGKESEGRAAPAAEEDIHTILFTDVEGSTALTDRLGDAKARGLLREHERIVREALKTHGGSEVKAMGDGFMASFTSATKALECAIGMQRAFAGRNESVEEPIRVRIGLNAGEPIAEDDPQGRGDLFGTAVNLAARIAGQAGGGEVLASDVVRQLVAGKGFLFADRGETELHGFEEPVRLYEVRWRED